MSYYFKSYIDASDFVARTPGARFVAWPYGSAGNQDYIVFVPNTV